MSDHIERPCSVCGSLLHHESDCTVELCQSCDERMATEDVGQFRWCSKCLLDAGNDYADAYGLSESEVKP